jgi:hypothetical protein
MSAFGGIADIFCKLHFHVCFWGVKRTCRFALHTSAFGPKQTFLFAALMSAFGGKADMAIGLDNGIYRKLYDTTRFLIDTTLTVTSQHGSFIELHGCIEGSLLTKRLERGIVASKPIVQRES